MDARSRLARAWIGALLLLACGLSDEQSYDVTGSVRSLDPARRQIEIAHDEIPGFMPAMTMNFDVVSPELLAGVEPGMQVRFQLERRATSLRITSLEITAGAAGVSGVAARGALADFDPAPDFELTDQRGARFSLAEQRGSVLLLDFVFTRCPGPCPILTARQVAVQRRIPEALRDRAHFISVSIDPAYDTPERLRAFGESHGADLAHWSFLTGSADEVQAVMDAYHVGAARQPGERLEHRIVTFLIGPGGRIRQRYLGLEHRPEEILSDLADLLGASGRDPS